MDVNPYSWMMIAKKLMYTALASKFSAAGFTHNRQTVERSREHITYASCLNVPTSLQVSLCMYHHLLPSLIEVQGINSMPPPTLYLANSFHVSPSSRASSQYCKNTPLLVGWEGKKKNWMAVWIS